MTLRAIQEQNAHQQQSLYRQALERSHAAWVSQIQMQQQLWAAWQEQQYRRQLGEQLFVDVQGCLEDTAAERAHLGLAGPRVTPGKIVGMFLEACATPELIRLTQDQDFFREMLFDALDLLKDAPAPTPAATVIQPPRPAVRGNEAMAAAADDTIRELLEDLRREEAGLPPLERPPSITSYERRPDGTVLRTALLA
jgi:hypothetical protein